MYKVEKEVINIKPEVPNWFVMGDPEQLFALLELMLRTFSTPHVPYVNIAGDAPPNVKAGGHNEEMFINLTDEERDEVECSICYQILKDTRQCENKHNFCYGCIYEWSTSGNPTNHLRCPVCRVDGMYMKNMPLDELVNSKRVKCLLKTCSWTGPLKDHGSHKHTTYSEGPAEKSDFPLLNLGDRAPSRSNASSSSRTTRGSSTPRSNNTTQRQPLTSTTTQNNNNTSQTPSNQRASVPPQNNNNNSLNATGRSRSRSRPRQSTSVQRRGNNAAANTSTTTSQNRLTSRARIQNGVSTNNNTNRSSRNTNQATQSENVEPATPGRQAAQSTLAPRPPTTPRPQRTSTRRMPTLPSIVSANENGQNNHITDSNANNVRNRGTLTSTASTETSESNTSNNNNHNVNISFSSNASTNVSSSSINNNNSSTIENARRSDSPPIAEPVMRFTIEPVYIRRSVRPNPNRGFTTIRDRLNESRQRLDMLMNAFSTELDRGHNDLTAFQEERERRRQQQLAEVRDLGRRLGHVAQELRGLLSQRREIRSQIDHLADSFSDDMD